jgi:uncharacterized membrane protein YkoI
MTQMQKGGHMRALVWMLIGLLAISLTACASDDQGKDYLLRHAAVTLSQAAEIAEVNGPGRAVKVELGRSGSRVFYDVEIVDAVNKSRTLRVDAESGKIIKGLDLPQ